MSSHYSHLLCALLLWTGAVACGPETESGPAAATTATNHPLIVELFAACAKGDVERLERSLSEESLAQLDRLFAANGSTRKSRLLRVAGILARVPVPSCEAAEKTGNEYRLVCRNLGRDLTLGIVLEEGEQKVLLPPVPSGLWSRLEKAPDRP